MLFTFPLSGQWVGWNPLAALVYAPSGALSQELYFRAALLPALTRLLPGRPRLALVVHSALFGLWHVGPPVRGSPPAAIIMVMLVPFFAGLVWGWQARRDETIGWVFVSHALVLSFWSSYTWV